jgi:hypothetical protein
MNSFLKKLKEKVRKQLSSQRVGYLLGAGSSFLDGNGYPLMTNLWDLICGEIPPDERAEIQAKLDIFVDLLQLLTYILIF